MTEAVAFMGGTFDPIHNGHLRTALEIKQLLGLSEIRLVPCHLPVHRHEPGCTSQQRLRMVELAVEGEPGLRVDDRELSSREPSYSINTLQSLRDELGPDRSLSMIMGMDSFLTLPSWHRWQEFLDLAHIVVVQRPGWRLTAGQAMDAWIGQRQVSDPGLLHSRPQGLLLMHQLTPLGISATQIRALVHRQQSPRYLIPDRVWHYIREQGLYLSEK